MDVKITVCVFIFVQLMQNFHAAANAKKLVINDSPQRLHHCPDECHCEMFNDLDLIKVNCSNRGLTEMPNHLPKGAPIVFIAKNNLISKLQYHGYLHRIQTLDLGHNRLNLITLEALMELRKVHELYLNNNDLTVLPRGTADIRFQQLINLDLSHNPWACRCNQQWFRNWLFDLEGAVSNLEGTTCGSGPQAGQKVTSLTDNYFSCSSEEASFKPIVMATLVTMSSFLILAILLFLLSKLLNRGCHARDPQRSPLYPTNV